MINHQVNVLNLFQRDMTGKLAADIDLEKTPPKCYIFCRNKIKFSEAKERSEQLLPETFSCNCCCKSEHTR